MPGPTAPADDARSGARLQVLYGGTFDPVHLGHLAIARAARDALGSVVHLMPAADPPHRAPPGASARQRADMLALALEGEPGLALDLRELGREGPSYTVDTLRDLRASLGPDAPVALLVGADSLLGLPGWHEWQALFGLAHLVVAERPGSAVDQALPAVLETALAGRWAHAPSALDASPAGRVLRLRQPLHPGSATEVRARIARGGDWQVLVPPAVAGYIARHRLYGLHGAATAPSL